jgi:hypothetical protein
MIDRLARDALSRAIRRLAAGRVTNDEFEDQLPQVVRHSRDPGVRAIWSAAWFLYDDQSEHRLEGAHALGRQGRRAVARWIVFLKSNEEYRWRDLSPWTRFLLLPIQILSFGLVGRALDRLRNRQGDSGVWPFIGRADLARAVSAWPRTSRT